MEFENELDKLRWMLELAEIPYESHKEEWADYVININKDYYSGNNQFFKNQIIYGIHPDDVHSWELDGICQLGSYGANEGLIETYGPLGTDAEGDPLVLTADEVFQIIKEDWEKKKGRKD